MLKKAAIADFRLQLCCQSSSFCLLNIGMVRITSVGAIPVVYQTLPSEQNLDRYPRFARLRCGTDDVGGISE